MGRSLAQELREAACQHSTRAADVAAALACRVEELQQLSDAGLVAFVELPLALDR